jgi:hypothetical protein
MTSRAVRFASPLASDALRQVTSDRLGCIRPIQLRRTNLDTGQITQPTRSMTSSEHDQKLLGSRIGSNAAATLMARGF